MFGSGTDKTPYSTTGIYEVGHTYGKGAAYPCNWPRRSIAF